MNHVGFTGTRHGMTSSQLDAVTMIMKKIAGTGVILAAHHGGCVGADAEFHFIARECDAIVEVHPGPMKWMRAALGSDPDCVHRVKSNFARNRDIVNASEVMIAAPHESKHQSRGGTWYTADYAARFEVPLALILPKRYGALIEFSGGWSWPDLPKEMLRP